MRPKLMRVLRVAESRLALLMYEGARLQLPFSYKPSLLTVHYSNHSQILHAFWIFDTPGENRSFVLFYFICLFRKINRYTSNIDVYELTMNLYYFSITNAFIATLIYYIAQYLSTVYSIDSFFASKPFLNIRRKVNFFFFKRSIMQDFVGRRRSECADARWR